MFADLGAARPDGICLDAEGAVWAAIIDTEVIRVRRGGEITDRVATGGQKAYACMLGGPKRTTLFLCTAAPPPTVKSLDGLIEMAEVTVPGAGRP